MTKKSCPKCKKSEKVLEILVSKPFLWDVYSQVYDHFLTNAHIYAHKKAHIYALQTSMWYMESQKSSYKRHRIIPAGKNPFMYHGPEKSDFSLNQAPAGGGLLPYMGYIGMCRCEGCGFQAVYSRIGYINQNIWV